jgi:alpha-ketoglutarate-dependent sulfate ester dioxygenase
MAGPRSVIEIRPIGGHIGAEIGGIDLADQLSDDSISAIREALWCHKVIFFRGQSRLDDDRQVNFAARIGRLTATAHPTHQSRSSDKPRISTLDSLDANLRTDHWHTDTTFVEVPPAGAILRAVVLPTHGGDTLWANTGAAYQALPAHLRSFADQLRCVHSNRWGYAHIRSAATELPAMAGESEFGASPFFGPPFETIHSLVCVHPRSGERVLLTGSHMRHILGLTASGSADLQRMLQEYIIRPEHTVRWRWAVGDVAIWDNIATQHYAARDYIGQRVMHRVSLAGDPLVGVDGTRSVARIGDLSSYMPPTVRAAS